MSAFNSAGAMERMLFLKHLHLLVDGLRGESGEGALPSCTCELLWCF